MRYACTGHAGPQVGARQFPGRPGLIVILEAVLAQSGACCTSPAQGAWPARCRRAGP